ncbi:MAG: hypothetical protein QXU32_01545 [Nitrososphaerales archaeon]
MSRRKVNPNRVAVLVTELGEKLIIRSNPTLKDVRSFIKEQNRRYEEGAPAGPDPTLPAFHIVKAFFCDSEEFIEDEDHLEEIPLK